MTDSFTETIKSRLDREPAYRAHLFCRSYLLTDAAVGDLDRYPFYGLWNSMELHGYTLLTHPDTKFFCHQDGALSCVLIGHAYDPFLNEIDENKILRQILSSCRDSVPLFLEAIDQLTGVFVVFYFLKDRLIALQDCGGQKMLYYGFADGKLVITSIPQLAGDVFHLEWDPDVLRLLQTKGYYRGSGYLPGNRSPYRELTRLGANTWLSVKDGTAEISRLYPTAPREEFRTETEKKAAIEELYGIFHSNLALAVRKWPRTAISLTGGMDSKTSFACAAPFYDQLYCFSFSSKPSEDVDARAAAEICRRVGVPHHRYDIPENPADIPDYEFQRKIIEHNTSHLCKLHENEIRKYIYLRGRNDFDVEIKSDMSEVGRAYFSRKYHGVKIPRIIAPRHLTITQGRYFLEPWAIRYADKCYASFMEQTGLTDDICGYSMHDLAYWEVRMSSWAATSFASQEYYHEITIPYNNRRLLDLFLRFPLDDRLQDIPHRLLMQRGNPAVAALDLAVKDSYFGKQRMLLETVYYYYATRLNTLGKK